MPPKVRITREEIIDKSIEIIRKEGHQSINARKIADELGCSTQPIFSNFKSMEDLKLQLLNKADEIYTQYRLKFMAESNYPQYKASGMSYISFAREEKELFKFLYMRDRTGEDTGGNFECVEDVISIIRENLGISREEAVNFHLEMWVFVHGIATMIATNYLDLSIDVISNMTSDMYRGRIKLLQDKEQNNVRN